MDQQSDDEYTFLSEFNDQEIRRASLELELEVRLSNFVNNVHFKHIFSGKREENDAPSTSMRLEWIEGLEKYLEKMGFQWINYFP